MEAVISATAAIADPIKAYRAIVPVLPYDPHCLTEEVAALLGDPGGRQLLGHSFAKLSNIPSGQSRPDHEGITCIHGPGSHGMTSLDLRGASS